MIWSEARSRDSALHIFCRVVNVDRSRARGESPVAASPDNKLRASVIHYPSVDQFLVAWEGWPEFTRLSRHGLELRYLRAICQSRWKVGRGELYHPDRWERSYCCPWCLRSPL